MSARSLRISDRADALTERTIDGYWPITVGGRLRQVQQLGARLGRLVLPPYVPAFRRETTDTGWTTIERGLVRATAHRAVRHWVGTAPSDPAECVGWRVLALVAAAKGEDPTLRFTDLGRLGLWPISLRLDAKRLRDRIGPLSTGTWCVACDDAPWASASRYCLWCERQGPPPRALAVAAITGAA
jgi:hypothetical protein